MRPFSKGAAELYIVSTLVVTVVAVGGFAPSLNLNAAVQHRYGPGVCGPADPFYIKAATMTGGQPFFLSPADISKSAHIMSASSQSELMLWAGGEGAARYVVPIDSSVKRTSFSATFDQTGGALTVISPDGTTIQPGEKIQDSVFSCGRVVTIDSPAVGPWRVAVAPSGRFWLRAQAKTELSIVSTEFVAPGGRPGHEGLFKIPGMPVAGRPAMLRVSFTSAPKRPVFQLASIDAQILEAISLEPESDDEFIGPVTLPERPFRVLVSGIDDAGTPSTDVSNTLHGRTDRGCAVDARRYRGRRRHGGSLIYGAERWRDGASTIYRHRRWSEIVTGRACDCRTRVRVGDRRYGSGGGVA